MIDRDVDFDVGMSDEGKGKFEPRRQSESLADRPVDAEKLKAQVLRCVGDDLRSVERLILECLDSNHGEVRQLTEKACSMGGKRLRPMLVLLSAQAATHGPQRPTDRDKLDLVRIATAVELVHTASLVHDDVMDEADSRRHQPTLYNMEGTSVAILLGDFLFTKAYAAAAGCRCPLVARRIAAAATKLCEGELRQQISVANWQLPISVYFDILVQKTASLCSTGCRLGAWQVGASTGQQKSLQRFGKWVGLAFQIFDDWLDYWGTDQAGKTLGTDLAQRKPTLPLLYFLEQCNSQQQNEVLQLIASEDSQGHEHAGELIRASSAGDLTLKKARELSHRAIFCLRDLPDSPAKSALESIALFSVNRSA